MINLIVIIGIILIAIVFIIFIIICAFSSENFDEECKKGNHSNLKIEKWNENFCITQCQNCGKFIKIYHEERR